LRHARPAHMPQPGQLRIIADGAGLQKLFEAQRQAHEPGDARHPPRRGFRSTIDQARGCLAALAHAATQRNLTYNRLR
jgi:hypothetical protein